MKEDAVLGFKGAVRCRDPDSELGSISFLGFSVKSSAPSGSECETNDTKTNCSFSPLQKQHFNSKSRA